MWRARAQSSPGDIGVGQINYRLTKYSLEAIVQLVCVCLCRCVCARVCVHVCETQRER